MSRSFEYYGNHVYGDGEAQPYYEGKEEPTTTECCLCYEEFADENQTMHLRIINKDVCLSCLEGEPHELLTHLQRVGLINPVDDPKSCLMLNNELISDGRLNFPVFRYMRGRQYGMNYNIELLQKIIDNDRRRTDQPRNRGHSE